LDDVIADVDLGGAAFGIMGWRNVGRSWWMSSCRRRWRFGMWLGMILSAA